jgi:hypothetical protein
MMAVPNRQTVWPSGLTVFKVILHESGIRFSRGEALALLLTVSEARAKAMANIG